MQRFINDPNQVVADMLAGFVAASSDLVATTDNPRVLVSTSSTEGRVGIVSGGGSGHEPAFLGYLGPGMLDAVAVGEVFSSPSARMFLDTFRAADSGNGVACLYGNYAGDNMNVKLAIRQAAAEGIEVKAVAARDDVLSAPVAEAEKRRGVAGEILMWKVGAACAADRGDLDSVAAAAQAALDATRSVGVGLSGCVIPAVGHPNFTIEPGMMEVGIGHHGETGVRVEPLKPAAEVAGQMLDAVLAELGAEDGDPVLVLLSGLGATPVMEAYILFAAVDCRLRAANLEIHRALVGDYFTSLEMMGATLTVMRLADDRLREWVDRPARCVAFRGLGL
ncbi:MAG TPA: dihydroxyacetone kinase subunit DhaK [Solirubrobacterales bacterium]